MKKARRVAPFWGGVITVLLAFGCLTSALAASGQVTYNVSNVSLTGARKITAGTELTAANGQKAPSSILYTDAAGGKTNYLPIRAISELLGVEIGYDSAARTILLGVQPSSNALADADWVADGYGGHVVAPDGTKTEVPHSFGC